MSRSPQRSVQYGWRAQLPNLNNSAISNQQNSEAVDYLRQSVFDNQQLQQDLEEMTAQNAMSIPLGPHNMAAKFDSFIQENSALYLDNDKLSRLLKQRKTEAEIWRQKYENQTAQVMQIKANYEIEIKELSNKIQKLNSKLNSSDFEKEREVSDHKVQFEINAQKEVDNAKKFTSQQIDHLEGQVRKLKEQLTSQNHHIDDLQAKLLRTKTEDDHQVERLLRENEALRNKVNEIEMSKQREFEELNENMNQYTISQIENLKKEFQHQSDVTEMEVEKLRGLLDIKNVEIETLLQQNQKNKCNTKCYIFQVLSKEETCQLRDEVLLMKQKLLEQERQNRNNLEQLAENLTDQHNRDIESLRLRSLSQINNLEVEINEIKKLLQNSEKQKQIQLDEKAELRAYLEEQLNDYRRDLDQQKQRYFELDQEKNREILEQEDSYRRTLGQIQEHCDQQRGQIQFLEGEITRQKELFDQKNKELDSNQQQFALNRRTNDDDIRRLKNEVERQRQEHQALEQQKNAEIEDLKVKLQRVEQQYREKLRQLEIALEQVELDWKRFREQLDVKGQEIDNLLHQRTGLERDLRRQRDESEQLKTRVIQLEREKNVQLEDLRSKLDSSNQYQINQLKAAFNTQIQVLNQENQSLRQTVDVKKSDIQELLEKYDQLKQSFKDGGFVTTEAAVNKNIYDVYLQSKRTSKNQNSNQKES